jgi:tRNA-dihydrouridine synthase
MQENLTTRNKLPKPFFVLAPMDDVTDTVFRQIVADCAPPDLFFTEFVNVDGLQSPGRKALLKKLQFTPKEQPLIAQIWGKNPENYFKTAQELIDMGFAGIDINMGCPIKDIVNNGCCCALINNRPLAVEIIKATQAGANGKLPVSVKTRLGFNEIDLSWHKLLLEQGLDYLTIHGRTRRQMSKDENNWQAIEDIRKLRDKIAPATLIIGNGDVASRRGLN